MKPHAKSALSLALAIVGGIAAGMRCDASVIPPAADAAKGAAPSSLSHVDANRQILTQKGLWKAENAPRTAGTLFAL